MGKLFIEFASWFGREMARIQNNWHSEQAMLNLVRTAVVVALPLMSTCCGERQEALYADAAAARNAGAIDRGWVPDWIPQTAHTIHERHDIATNQSMLAFRFSPTDEPKLSGACKQVQRDSLKAVPFSVRWWPNDEPPSRLVTYRHTYYECPGGAFVAVSMKTGELFYWVP